MTALLFIAALSAPPAHVEAATVAARQYELSADLLLSIAWEETRHRAWLVSHTDDCGPMQVHTKGADTAYCKRLAGVAYGYREGARMLRAWIDVKGGLVDGLGSYACGHRITKRCRMWAMRVTATWVLRTATRGVQS